MSFVKTYPDATSDGSATAANQVTGNASLASIDSKLTAPIIVTGPLTDTQLRATPVPVSATFSLPTGASTSALQVTGNASLASIDTKLTSPLTVTGGLTDTQLRATPVPVSGPLTDTQLRATPVPVSGTVTANAGTGTFSVSQGTPTAKTITQAAVTVGTTAVRATVSGSAPAATRVLLVVNPDKNSPALFYIGSSTVTSSGATRGMQLQGGQSFTANSDAGDYYIISDTAAQTVYIMEQA